MWPLLTFFAKNVIDGNRGFEIRNIEQMSNGTKSQLFEALWFNLELLDAFIEVNPHLNDEKIKILTSWKKVVSSEFIVERYLKNGTIFIDMKTNKVYQVCGIISDFDEMLSFTTLPTIVRANLIPFKDKIITDGLVIPYGIRFGSNFKTIGKNIYMKANKTNTIIKSL